MTIIIISALFFIYIVNRFNKNVYRINVKTTSGCDERYDYLNQQNITSNINNINNTNIDEFKYKFSKKLLCLHLLNMIRNPTISIYYKALLIDRYNIFDDFSHNMITNKDTIIGYNIMSGGLLNDWDFEM